MSDLATDCLMATVGLMPDEVTSRQRAAAATLPDTFASRAASWWTEEKPKKFSAPKVPKLDVIFDKIALPPTQPEVKAWLHESPDDDDDTALLLYLAITQARKLLVDRWPRIVLASFAGERLMPLAVDDQAEVASLFAVLNEPTRILDEMDMNSLSPSQAEVFRTAYPELFTHYRFALGDGAAKLAKKDPAWMPTEKQSVLLSVLTGRPAGVLTYEAEAPSKDKPKQPKDLGASNAETQEDRSSKPKGGEK